MPQFCEECLKNGLSIKLHKHRKLKDGRQVWICLPPSKRHPTAKGCGKTTRDNPKKPHRPTVNGEAMTAAERQREKRRRDRAKKSQD